MFKLVVSFVAWFLFLAACTVVIKFGLFLNDVQINWMDALWYGLVVRALFYLNQGYTYIRKDLGI
jgi:hypothetical protein